MRYGVFGAGHLGRIHLRCILESDRLELAGFYDPDPATASRVAAELGVPAFPDAGSLIDACDIVLTVSNTTAHLSAALGKPTLILLPWHTPLWYWHLNSMDSRWYPSAVLLRQGTTGDWSEPVGQAAKIIQGLAHECVQR